MNWGELAATLNALLGRLDESFAAQRRFMADASHELRSPSPSCRRSSTCASLAMTANAADYRESLEVMRRSVRR